MQPLSFAKKHVLIVGAGAIGQVYGNAIHKGGTSVGVLIRPHQKAKVEEEGFYLHKLGIQGRRPGYENFQPDFVYTDHTEIAGIWNEVWICTAADSIYQPWFGELMQRLPANCTVVLTGIVNLEYVSQFIPLEQVVTFLVSMVSYPGPLPDEEETYWPPGIVYFLPPMMPSLFSGKDQARAYEVVRSLANTGVNAKYSDNAQLRSETGSAMLMPLVAGLELEGWSLDRFRKSGTLPVFIESFCQLSELAYRRQNRSVGKIQGMLHKILRSKNGPKVFAGLLGLAPSLTPFPLESYLKFHFTKVRSQTGVSLEESLQHAAKLGLNMNAVELLLGYWKKLPAPPKAQQLVTEQPAQLQPSPMSAQPAGYDLPTQPVQPGQGPLPQPGVALGEAGGLEEDTEPPQ